MNFRESLPNRLGAGFAVALASEETTEVCDQAQYLVERGLRRSRCFREQVRSPDFIGIEEQTRVQIRTGSTQPHQVCHAPSHHKKQRQCALESFNRAQLQLFDLTAVLQNVEQGYVILPINISRMTS